MGAIPPVVDDLLTRALVCELAVVNTNGEPVVHPLIPLWDGKHVYMTSSVLFSKKLEHIKRDRRVSLSITDPIATGGSKARCVIQGDARIIEDDPHETWEEVLPLWRAKEPAIDSFLGKRFALPLFFERALIQVTPTRVSWWADGDPSQAPQTLELAGAIA